MKRLVLITAFLLAGTAAFAQPFAGGSGPATGTGYPAGAIPITGAGTGSTGAVTASLAGAVGRTTFICGLNVSAIGGSATIGPITVANLTGNSFVVQMASTAAGNTLVVPFSPCIPASGQNTTITVTTTADGTASAVDVNMWGYQF